MSAKFNIGANYKDGKKTKCQWKGCEPNTHPYRITYIKGGVVQRAKYTGTWDKHISHGCDLQEPGNILIQFKPGKFVTSTHSNFWFQKHHVIPVSVMGKVKNISHNLKLLGWDMNNGDLNGMCLPFNYEEIKRYDLQAHRGSHPSYNLEVLNSLNNLDKTCKKFCKTDNQDKLLEKIQTKVTLFKLKIKRWQVILHAPSPLYR